MQYINYTTDLSSLQKTFLFDSVKKVNILNHMVEYSKSIDEAFHALADGTRRDILRRTLTESHTISSLSVSYEMSFAAVAKHVNVLHKAQLIIKYRVGREQVISANIERVQEIQALLDHYEQIWRSRLDNLDTLLPHL